MYEGCSLFSFFRVVPGVRIGTLHPVMSYRRNSRKTYSAPGHRGTADHYRRATGTTVCTFKLSRTPISHPQTFFSLTLSDNNHHFNFSLAKWQGRRTVKPKSTQSTQVFVFLYTKDKQHDACQISGEFWCKIQTNIMHNYFFNFSPKCSCIPPNKKITLKSFNDEARIEILHSVSV